MEVLKLPTLAVSLGHTVVAFRTIIAFPVVEKFHSMLSATCAYTIKSDAHCRASVMGAADSTWLSISPLWVRSHPLAFLAREPRASPVFYLASEQRLDDIAWDVAVRLLRIVRREYAVLPAILDH